MTLVEVIVASAIMGIIMLALGAVYRMGAADFSQTMAHSEMLGQARVVAGTLSREVGTSSYDSLSISDDRQAASFLVRFGTAGTFAFNPADGRPLWQSYVVYYLEDGALKRRLLPLPAGGLDHAIPIEEYAPWGRKPVNSWRGDGAMVAAGLKVCRFESFSGRLRLTLQMQYKRVGRDEPEHLDLTFTTMFRNRR